VTLPEVFMSSSVDMRNLPIAKPKRKRNINGFLIRQNKSKLECITFYYQICEESLDAGFHCSYRPSNVHS